MTRNIKRAETYPHYTLLTSRLFSGKLLPKKEISPEIHHKMSEKWVEKSAKSSLKIILSAYI